MRIDPTAASLQSLLIGTVAKAAKPSVPTEPGAAPGVPAPSATAPPQSVATLVAIAAAAPEVLRRRADVRAARAGVDRLAALHRDAVAGVVGAARLQALAEWVEHRSPSDDTALETFLQDVELRILVELAKRERDHGDRRFPASPST